MKIEELVTNKTILIVGGSSSASKKTEEWYNSFDIIVRCNNYKKATNSRTDIFYSYFGRNIKKTPEELKKDGVKFLINKCPNEDMSKQLTKYNISMTDFRWIYELRKTWWFCDLHATSAEEILCQIHMIDNCMPTTGLSAVLFFVKRHCDINIIGFDCFESNVHNLNEVWDKSGNHNLKKEREILAYLEKKGSIIWNR